MRPWQVAALASTAAGFVIVAGVWVGASIGRLAPAGGSGRPIQLYAVDAPNDPRQAFNVLFVASQGDFGDMRDEKARKLLTLRLRSHTLQPIYDHNKVIAGMRKRLNFWLADQPAQFEAVAGQCPRLRLPAVYGGPLGPDAIVVVHAADADDCSFDRVSTSEVDSPGTLLHELSHSLFGMPDEYCCYGGYWHAPPMLQAAGQTGAAMANANAGRCTVYNCAFQSPNATPCDAKPGGSSTLAADLWVRANCAATVMTQAGDKVPAYDGAAEEYLERLLESTFPAGGLP